MKLFRIALLIALAAAIFVSAPLYAENEHGTVVHESVKKTIRALESRCGVKSNVLEIGYLDGWKKSGDGTVWGRHYFRINLDEGSLTGNDLCVTSILNTFIKLNAGLEGNTVKGFSYTRGSGDGIRLVDKNEFENAPGEEYSMKNQDDSFRRKILPIYVNLDTSDVQVDNITSDKKALGPSGKIKLRVYGTIKTNLKRAEVILSPEVMDLDKNNRRDDVLITDIHGNENAVMISGKGNPSVRIKPNMIFDFVADIQAKNNFKKGRQTGLYLTVFLNRKKNPPMIFPLENEKEIPWYFYAVAGLAAVALGLAGYFFIKGKGVRHDRYDIALKIISGPDSGKAYLLGKPSVVAGRLDPGADGIVVNSDKASRKHAVFTRTRKGYAVTDSRSTNGTFVNGIRIAEGVVHELKDGDEVKIANISLLYSIKRKKRK